MIGASLSLGPRGHGHMPVHGCISQVYIPRCNLWVSFPLYSSISPTAASQRTTSHQREASGIPVPVSEKEALAEKVQSLVGEAKASCSLATWVQGWGRGDLCPLRPHKQHVQGAPCWQGSLWSGPGAPWTRCHGSHCLNCVGATAAC